MLTAGEVRGRLADVAKLGFPAKLDVQVAYAADSVVVTVIRATPGPGAEWSWTDLRIDP